MFLKSFSKFAATYSEYTNFQQVAEIRRKASNFFCVCTLVKVMVSRKRSQNVEVPSRNDRRRRRRKEVPRSLLRRGARSSVSIPICTGRLPAGTQLVARISHRISSRGTVRIHSAHRFRISHEEIDDLGEPKSNPCRDSAVKTTSQGVRKPTKKSERVQGSASPG